MKLINLAFLLLILISGLLLLVALAPEPETAAVGAHPIFAGMQAAGDGQERLAAIGVYAYVMQALVLVLVIVLLSMGVARSRRTGVYWSIMGVIVIAMLGVWAMINVSHRAFLDSSETGYFLGFPIATAWMIYGVFFAGALLVLFYVVKFRRYFYSEDDDAEFEKLLLDLRQQSEKDGDPEDEQLVTEAQQVQGSGGTSLAASENTDSGNTESN